MNKGADHTKDAQAVTHATKSCFLVTCIVYLNLTYLTIALLLNLLAASVVCPQFGPISAPTKQWA